MTSPILRWAGGKSRLLADLTWRLPARWDRYFEPFMGGAALFFRLAPERAVLGDANADLVAMYRALAGDVESVIAALRQHEIDHGPAHFAEVRDAFNAHPERHRAVRSTTRAARLLYLNRACFNGLWRVNASGAMNSPWGKRAAVRFDYDNLRAAAWALRRADLRACDYRETIADARRGDLVYLDSPYDGTWVGYTAGGFGPEQQRELAAEAQRLVRRGVRVLASNSDTPLVRELYDGWRIDVVRCDRRIAARTEGRAAVNEVIAIGGYEPSVQGRLMLGAA